MPALVYLMYPQKNSLSIQLTEPVVPLRGKPERASRHHNDEMLPPATVRGLLTLKLAKPTKVSSINVELQAKATTRYTQCAGPSRTDVTEQYSVHSASAAFFKAYPVPQVRQHAALRSEVAFGSDVPCGTDLDGVGSGHQEAALATRSASLGPRSPRIRRRLNSNDTEVGDGRHPQRDQNPIDSPPPYPSPAPQHSFLHAGSYPSAAGRSHSVASSSRIMEPQSSPILSQSSLGSDIPCSSQTCDVHPIRDFALSRTSSIEEVLEDGRESVDTSSLDPGDVAYYGLSRIATVSPSRSLEQDNRGRSHSRFSFRKVVHVFHAAKDRVRSRSPRTGSLTRVDERERGRPAMKENGKDRVRTHDVRPALTHIKSAEPSVADGAKDQSGDGWVMFAEGTYTYPIFFTIPNNSPPTMRADHGSLIWKVKAEIKCPSVFKSRMTAQKEVVVVCLPKEDESEEAEGLDLQRQWEGQFQYRVQIAGQGFPVGGRVPLQLTIMPLAKVKVHCIQVYLDERTEYFTRAKTSARSDAIRRATLLVIRHNNSDERHSKPILPLGSDEPDALRDSPLYRFLRPGEDENEVASSLMGPGPWTIRHQLRLPDSCSILYPSNRIKGSNIMVNHTLKIVLRVEKEEVIVTTGRKKLYDIIIQIPIQILSCRCTSEWVSLPRYDETLRSESDVPEDPSTCPCRARHQAQTHPHAADILVVPLERVMSFSALNSNAAGAFPSDSLARRTDLHERLMSGFVSERGEVPPPYEHSAIVCV